MHSEYTADLEKSNTISQKSLVFKKKHPDFQKKKPDFKKKVPVEDFPYLLFKKKARSRPEKKTLVGSIGLTGTRKRET